MKKVYCYYMYFQTNNTSMYVNASTCYLACLSESSCMEFHFLKMFKVVQYSSKRLLNLPYISFSTVSSTMLIWSCEHDTIWPANSYYWLHVLVCMGNRIWRRRENGPINTCFAINVEWTRYFFACVAIVHN